MNLKSILAGPIYGKVSNKKLNLKDSIILNLVLSLSIAVAFFLRIKLLISNAKSVTSSFLSYILPSEVSDFIDMIGSMGSYKGLIDIDPFVNTLLFKLSFYFILMFIAISLCVSAIMFAVSKYIFNLENSFEECFSTYTYANIIPSFVLIAGILISIISGKLFMCIIYMNIICLLICAYEGFSELISNRKSKLILSVAISYFISFILVNRVAFSSIMSSIENAFENLWK